MRYLAVLCLGLVLAACAADSVQVSQRAGFVPRLKQQLFVVPFDTVMVPEEVAALLFNQFVDRLDQAGAEHGFQVVILKQGLSQIAPEWLAERDYLVGEVYAYVEEVGSSATGIKARSRIRLFQSGQNGATLELTRPAETFFENDYSSLPTERRKLAETVSADLVDQLLKSLFGS